MFPCPTNCFNSELNIAPEDDSENMLKYIKSINIKILKSINDIKMIKIIVSVSLRIAFACVKCVER